MKLINELPACFSNLGADTWLQRFLPPLGSADLTGWLAQQLPANSRLLDPFGALPDFPIHLAERGHQVVAAAGNPLLHFLQTLSLSPQPASAYRAALAALGATRKGKERVALHISAQYRSRCAQCGQQLEAQAFLWERDHLEPQQKIIHCPVCNARGAQPADSQDREIVRRLARLTPAFHARTLQRIAPPDSPLRQAAAAALAVYPPRALYVISILIDRFQRLSLPEEQKLALTALLLHAFDQGNSLHAYPRPKARPRELHTPPVFREHNLWQALEAAINQLTTDNTPPIQAEKIRLFPGPVRQMKNIAPFAAAVGVVPRLNQAFWAFSALWSGWLWGQQAAQSFAFGLVRRRFTWRWYAEALRAALQCTRSLLTPPGTLVLFIPEAESGLLRAVLLAADAAGFTLQSLALNEADDLAVGKWQAKTILPDRILLPQVDSLQAMSSEAAQKLVNQPVSPRWQQTAALALHAGRAGLCGTKQEVTTVYDEWGQRLEALSPPPRPPQRDILPLDEAVEREIVTRLQREALPHSLNAILRQLATTFPGLQTPDRSWVQAVLQSYAQETADGWQLRPEDRAAARRQDLAEIIALLETTGRRLGYPTRRETHPFRRLWWGEERVFWLGASTLITAWLLAGEPQQQNYLVLPGSRSPLLLKRQARNPWLRAQLVSWPLLKFRHIRRLAALPHISHDRLDDLLTRDPAQENEGQLPLL